MMIDIRRTLTGEVNGRKEYCCVDCGCRFAADFSILAGVNKSADLIKSLDEERKMLQAEWEKKAVKLRAEHEPAAACPRCGEFPRSVLIFYSRLMGLRFLYWGAGIGLAMSFALGYMRAQTINPSDAINSMPLWSIAGVIPGAVIGFAIGTVGGIRLKSARDKAELLELSQ